MTSESTKTVNLLGHDRAGLENFFVGLGEKPFRAKQFMQWVHQRQVLDFAQMTDMSKSLRERLAAGCNLDLPEITFTQKSLDGTVKWVLQLHCGNRIETVFIPEPGRGTLCVSSQAGCALDCAFCSTAKQGFNRNLSAAEIVAQIWIAQKHLPEDTRVTNVVLMGMGEPLTNFSAVVSATNVMRDDYAFGLSKRRVTISTAGVVPALYRLAEVSDISLAVSLHAPNDELRNQLVPINRKYPLVELLEACRHYIGQDRRKVTMEYVMLDGVNDSTKHARQLVKLLKDFPAKMNLIPFNPFPGTEFRRSKDSSILRFADVLQDSSIITTIRRTRGDDIDAACGQLVGKVADRSRRTRVMPEIRQ